jgi:hypothetical protein
MERAAKDHLLVGFGLRAEDTPGVDVAAGRAVGVGDVGVGLLVGPALAVAESEARLLWSRKKGRAKQRGPARRKRSPAASLEGGFPDKD